MRVTGGRCTMPAIRIWQTTPLIAPRKCLKHTNPRSAAPATSPNSAAPLNTPHPALAAGADTPQPTALGNYQLRVSSACQWPHSQSRPNLKFQQQRAVMNHNSMPATRIKSLQTQQNLKIIVGWGEHKVLLDESGFRA